MNPYKIFPDADKRIKKNPIGIVLIYAGFKGGYIKRKVYGIIDDPLKVNNCKLFLVKFLDGSPVLVRYDINNYKKESK